MKTNPRWKKMKAQVKQKAFSRLNDKEQLKQVAQAIWHNSPLLD
jgi:cystathionine beta-lyase family protein involved in aluminum resistance